MKIKIFIIACLITISNYSQNNSSFTGYSPAAYDLDYQAPCFLNSNRVQKIGAVFPVVEKLFKEYAEKNNFPGLAFSVVMDGGLLFSGSFGYTDISKKTSADKNSMSRIASMTQEFHRNSHT